MMAFNTGCVNEAKALVLAHHYSRRWPSTPLVIGIAHNPGGLFGDIGEAVAACVFSLHPTRWSVPVLELVRLVRTDSQIPLTPLIAFTCKAAKAKGADLLVSFADSTQGHHGGIYQAASWNFHKKNDPQMDGVVFRGTFIPGRSCNARWGTRSPEKLSAILGCKVEPHYDSGKYLYWRAMTKAGKRAAAKLGLEANEYPKPGEKKAPENRGQVTREEEETPDRWGAGRVSVPQSGRACKRGRK